jgi:hypothetical protein
MLLTLKYDVLRAVVMLQTLASAPDVMAIVRAVRQPEADVVPMIWKQTQTAWNNGKPWLSAARQKLRYLISYTNHGWEAYSSWTKKPVIGEANEKKWIDEVRAGWKPEVENAAIPSNKRYDDSYKYIDIFALYAKQLGCQMSEIHGLLQSGEIKVCTAPGCERKLKKASDFYNGKNRCKECIKRERIKKDEKNNN